MKLEINDEIRNIFTLFDSMCSWLLTEGFTSLVALVASRFSRTDG